MLKWLNDVSNYRALLCRPTVTKQQTMQISLLGKHVTTEEDLYARSLCKVCSDSMKNEWREYDSSENHTLHSTQDTYTRDTNTHACTHTHKQLIFYLDISFAGPVGDIRFAVAGTTTVQLKNAPLNLLKLHTVHPYIMQCLIAAFRSSSNIRESHWTAF